MPTRLTRAVQAAIAAAPVSERHLARAAGVSYTLLQMIRQGQREATPRVAEAVAAALERWERDCARASARLRGAIRGERGNR